MYNTFYYIFREMCLSNYKLKTLFVTKRLYTLSDVELILFVQKIKI